jgi:hypothetical protein
MLSAKVWSVETPADKKRLERQMLFPGHVFNRHLWPNELVPCAYSLNPSISTT